VTTRAAGYAIALDVGGTFTDVALVHEASGRLWVTKTPTTPADPSTGFIAGVDKALRLAGVAPAALRHVLHGTTTATNAILESKGAPSGLLTTAGFRDVLEIGRHDIPRRANMFAWVKPTRPVAPELIFEIGGRVAVDGTELEPLDEAAVRAAARRSRPCSPTASWLTPIGKKFPKANKARAVTRSHRPPRPTSKNGAQTSFAFGSPRRIFATTSSSVTGASARLAKPIA